MDVYDTIQSILDVNNREIIGRTAIQKLTYFSKNLIPNLDIPSYKPHYYGPFSSELGHALEKLVSYAFVSEDRVPGNIHESYNYTLTKDGKQSMLTIKENYKDKYNKIKEIVHVCNRFCKSGIAPLSYASKILYMSKSQYDDEGKMSFNEIAEHAKKLGWNISQDNVEQSTKLLESLKLESR